MRNLIREPGSSGPIILEKSLMASIKNVVSE